MRASFLKSLPEEGGNISLSRGDVAGATEATEFEGEARTITNKAGSNKRRPRKAAEAEDLDAGYRDRMALLEERMRASLMNSLSEH